MILVDDFKTEEGFIPLSSIESLVDLGFVLKQDEYLLTLWKGDKVMFLFNQPIKWDMKLISSIGDAWFPIKKPYKLPKEKSSRLPFETLELFYNIAKGEDFKRDYLLKKEELIVWIDHKTQEDEDFLRWFESAYYPEFKERIPERFDSLEADIPDSYHAGFESFSPFVNYVHEGKTVQLQFPTL